MARSRAAAVPATAAGAAGAGAGASGAGAAGAGAAGAGAGAAGAERPGSQRAGSRARTTPVEAASGGRVPAPSLSGDPHAGPALAAAAPPEPDPVAPSEPIQSLDRAFLRIRRALVKPVTTLVPLPSLGRTCDLAKVLACETISALTAGATAGPQGHDAGAGAGAAAGAPRQADSPGATRAAVSSGGSTPPDSLAASPAVANSGPAPATASTTPLSPIAPPTVKDVAAAMELDHSTTSRLLGEAEAEGLVIRGSDPTDRRRTTVALTDRGRGLVADATAIRRWTLAETFRDWDDADVALLASLMERLATTIAERGEDVKAAAFEHFGAAIQTYQA